MDITLDTIIKNPRRSQGYISFDCPGCGKKNKAFKYDNSPLAKCNRGSCGWSINFAELQKDQKIFQNNFKSNTTDAQEDTSTDRTNRVSGALGHSAGSVDRYLDMRILRHIPNVSIENVLERKFFGLSSMVRESRAKKWDRQDYRLFTPLYCMGTGKILSGQHRYTGLGLPPETKDGTRLPKNVSMRGSYGRFGVTFGNLCRVLAAAKEMSVPRIYIVEGDLDFITMRSMGFDTCVGVPGAGQAKKVISHLNSQNWAGEVVLCLDNDPAGSKATEQAINFAIINCGDRIVVSDSTPGKEGYDVTDSLANFGLDFTCKMILNSRKRSSISEQRIKIFETEHYQKILEAGIVAPKSPIQKVHKERIANNIETTGAKKSPLYKFRRVAHCGSLMETELVYSGDDVRLETTIYKRCSSRWCDHCRVTQWNYGITKKLIETWPERLSVGEHAFEDIEGLKNLKRSIFSLLNIPSDQVQNDEDRHACKTIHVHANIESKKLIVIADREELQSIGLQSICPIHSNRDAILRDYLMPAYLSTVRYLKAKAEDPDWLLHQDEFLSTKTKLFHSRSGLPWPKQEEVRETVAEFFKELHESDEEEQETKDETSIFVSYAQHSAGKIKLLSVSGRKFSFDGLSKSLMFDGEIETNPQDPTINYLQEPDLCPRQVEDVIRDFIELSQRVPLEKAEYELHSPWRRREGQKTARRFNQMTPSERKRHWDSENRNQHE